MTIIRYVWWWLACMFHCYLKCDFRKCMNAFPVVVPSQWYSLKGEVCFPIHNQGTGFLQYQKLNQFWDNPVKIFRTETMQEPLLVGRPPFSVWSQMKLVKIEFIFIHYLFKGFIPSLSHSNANAQVAYKVFFLPSSRPHNNPVREIRLRVHEGPKITQETS